MALYLYGIIKETELSYLRGVEITGMGDAPVLWHSLPPYVIIFSETREERYLASRAHLLTHEGVLEQLMKLIPNDQAVPLPLQFGLVVADWAQVKEELIEPYGHRLDELLAKLVGKCEVGIKVFWQPEAELKWLVDQNPVLQAKRASLSGRILSMDEAVAIGQELEATLESRQKLIVDTCLQALLPLTVEYAEGELLTDNMVCNCAFLIDSGLEADFAQRVEGLDEHFERRYRIRYNNFTAPYNFVAI